MIVCCYAEIPSSRIQYILHLVDVDVPLTKEEFALAKKTRGLLPPPGFILPGDPILVVLRHNGNASESTSMSGWIPWARISTPRVKLTTREDDYSDGVQLQIET
ncbi:Hypothetical protein FKW44_015237, partial [Caligus rogercresseyi]